MTELVSRYLCCSRTFHAELDDDIGSYNPAILLGYLYRGKMNTGTSLD